MRLLISLLILIFNTSLLNAQGNSPKNRHFERLPESYQDIEKLLIKATEQKGLDYWEYWFVEWKNQDVTPFDDSLQKGKIIYNRKIISKGGISQTTINSQLINHLNPSSGFWNIPPGGDTYNLVYINNGRPFSITSEDSLAEFLKPIKSVEQAIFYAYLKGYSLRNLMYRKNELGFFELKMQSNKPARTIEKKSGAVWIYSNFLLKINENGVLSREFIGEKRYKFKKNPVIP